MSRTALFVSSLIGMAASAAVLILLLPSLFRAGEQGSVLGLTVWAVLTLVFAVGTRYWRPSPPVSDS